MAGHEGLDPPITGRAPVVERQIRVDDIGDEVGAPHGEPANRVGLDIVARLEKVLGPGEPFAESVGTIEDDISVVDHVHDIGRRGSAQQQRRRARCVDYAVMGIERDREQRALLPFENVALALALLPDFGAAAAFHHQHHLFVEMSLDVERTCRRGRVPTTPRFHRAGYRSRGRRAFSTEEGANPAPGVLRCRDRPARPRPP